MVRKSGGPQSCTLKKKKKDCVFEFYTAIMVKWAIKRHFYFDTFLKIQISTAV
jgi:hypothetical protein